jgi:hypothetical protein
MYLQDEMNPHGLMADSLDLEAAELPPASARAEKQQTPKEKASNQIQSK